MTGVDNNNGQPILVEWAVRPGRQQVSSFSKSIGEGEEALKKALDVVESVAGNVSDKLSTLIDKPEQRELDEVQVEFGLKLDAQAGAFIAKAGIEAGIVVRMTWKREG